MKLIPVGNGMFTRVSDEDYQKVAGRKWTARRRRNTWYAQASATSEEVKNGSPKTIYMHRVILGAKRGQKVDHQDLDGLNNLPGNIRITTTSENGRNARKTTRPRTSRYKGVHWNK